MEIDTIWSTEIYLGSVEATVNDKGELSIGFNINDNDHFNYWFSKGNVTRKELHFLVDQMFNNLDKTGRPFLREDNKKG